MGDQHRWFKLWCSAPSDDAIQALNPALRWAWAALGCYTKLHGSHGRLTVSATNATLAAQMGVPVEQLFQMIKLMPNIIVERVGNSDDKLSVTWKNWHKYQEDSTGAKRQAASRSKKREEENRKESPHTPRLELTIEQAISEYESLPVYRLLDVPATVRRIANWCVQNKKPLTKRRIESWLGKDALKATAHVQAVPRTGTWKGIDLGR